MKSTGIKVNGLTFYVRVDGTQATARIGSKGKLQALPQVHGSMGKGESRRLRKQLRSAGFSGAAGIARMPELANV